MDSLDISFFIEEANTNPNEEAPSEISIPPSEPSDEYLLVLWKDETCIVPSPCFILRSCYSPGSRYLPLPKIFK